MANIGKIIIYGYDNVQIIISVIITNNSIISIGNNCIDNVKLCLSETSLPAAGHTSVSSISDILLIIIAGPLSLIMMDTMANRQCSCLIAP